MKTNIYLSAAAGVRAKKQQIIFLVQSLILSRDTYKLGACVLGVLCQHKLVPFFSNQCRSADFNLWHQKKRASLTVLNQPIRNNPVVM